MPLVDFLRAAAPAIGTVAGGPVGGAIGTFLSGALGSIQAEGLHKDYQKKADAIPATDPGQVALLDKVRMRQRMYDAGTNRLAQNRMRQINQAGATTQANIARQTGGSAGGAIQGLLSSQSVTQSQLPNALNQNEAVGNQLLGMEGGLVQDMGARRYALQRYTRDVAMSRYALAQQGAEANMMAATGMLPELKFSGLLGGGQQPATTGGAIGALAGANIGMAGEPPVQNMGFRGVPINYESQLLGTAQGPAPNYGFGYQQPRPNFAFNNVF